MNEVRRGPEQNLPNFEVFSHLCLSMVAIFTKLRIRAVKEKGKDHLLSQVLIENQVSIKTWIDIRIAIEHPRKDAFVETLNFALEPDRKIRLPTWRFVHPDHKMARPQNLLDVFEMCIENVLGFFEVLQIALLDGNIPDWIKVDRTVAEADADVNEPVRYRFQVFPQTFRPRQPLQPRGLDHLRPFGLSATPFFSGLVARSTERSE